MLTLSPLLATVSVTYDHATQRYHAEPSALVNGGNMWCEGVTYVQAAANLKGALADLGFYIPGFKRTQSS